MNGLECTVQNVLMSLNTLQILHEIKNVGGIIAKPALEKGKIITTETIHLVTNIYEDDNFSR